MRGLLVKKIREVKPPKNKGAVYEGSQTLPQPAAKSTPDTRKRHRKPTVSPEVSVVEKPAETSRRKRGRRPRKRPRKTIVRAQKRCSLYQERE